MRFREYFLLLMVVLNACKPSKPILILDYDSKELSKNEKVLVDDELIEVVTDSESKKCIEVSYVGYERGSKRIVHNINLSKPLIEATLNYEVKFDSIFKFVHGGKLHGLGPKHKVTGGYPIHPSGWSARIMFLDSGKVTPYIYHQDMIGKYGEGEHSKFPVFTPGKWHKVAIYVKLNNPPVERNGIFEVWIDNLLIQKVDSLKYRGVGGDSTLINQMLFSTFHGGNNPSYSPKDKDGKYTTVKAWFDNFRIYDRRYIEN